MGWPLIQSDFGSMHVHSKTKGISALERSDGSLTSNESEMVKILNNFFSSVFTNEYLMCHHWNQSVWRILCHLFMYPWIVFGSSCVILINPSKSSGPDDCHPHVFKEVKEGLL